MYPSKIPTFATANDTQQYAVCVDGLFGFLATRADAERVYDLICPLDTNFDDTVFGDCQLLPPGYRPRMAPALATKLGEPEDMTRAVLSHHRAIDIEGYITKRPTRQSHQDRHEIRTTAQRLADKRAFDGLFAA